MLYAYEIKETQEGFVGYVSDLDFSTKPQKTFEDAENVLTDAFLAYIEVVYRKNRKNNTLEPCLLACNELSVINQILNRNDATKESLLQYMLKNKTKCALQLFDTKIEFNIPDYIQEAVNDI